MATLPATAGGDVWGQQLNDYILQTERRTLAAAILARLAQPDGRKTQLYAGTAPVWSANAASQIAGGLLRAPRRLVPPNLAWASSTALAEDPHLRFVAGNAAYGTAFPDYNLIRTPLLTGGSSQAAYWPLHTSFFYDGTSFEVLGKTFTTSSTMRLRIDGVLVTTAMQVVATALTAGSQYYYRCNLGSAAMRHIDLEIEGANPAFGGIVVEPTAMISRGMEPSLRVALESDSIGAGATDYSRNDSWFGVMRELIGGNDVAALNLGIGGTGYSTTAGTSDFVTRIPDIVAANPDIVFVEGEQNDGSMTQAQIQTAATTVLQALATQLPRALVFVVGSYSATTPSLLKMQHEAGLRAAAAATGAYFISWVDPLNMTSGPQPAPAFVGGAYYTRGDVAKDPATGHAWTCITEHTAAATFSAAEQASWKPTSVIFGTGRVGATAGNGNADVMVATDAIHPTVRGSQALGRSAYRQFEAHLRAIATQSSTRLVG